MAIPTHSSFCVTRAFPTACPDCRDKVWFFSCNCGSKIYFNELGEPWPIHQCRHHLVRQAVEMLRINDRLSDEEIYSRIDSMAQERNFEIPEEVIEMLQTELGKRKKPFRVTPIADLSKFSDISGKVIEINRQVSFRSRLDIDLENAMNTALAGDLLKYTYAELVIRENPDSNNCSREFTVYLKLKFLSAQPLFIGKTLLATIIPINNRLRQVWEIVEFKSY